MNSVKTYVALGGNIGDVQETFQKALQFLGGLPEVSHLTTSSFHWNPAISPIPQGDFLNGVCCFYWSKGPLELLRALQKIQRNLGQYEKPKEAPRIIDLDLLFFGNEKIQTADLEVPHPRWQGRLFVLEPLAELTTTIEVGGEIFNIVAMKESFYAKTCC